MVPVTLSPRRMARRRVCGALVAVPLLAAVGCAAPERVTWMDQGQAAISRGIGDVVDAVDGAFGEPRVADREELVQVKLGAALRVRENSGTSRFVPLSLRVPLPALERRANVFIQADAIAAAFGDRGSAAALDRNKTITAAVITRVANTVHAGVRLDLIWDDGPDTGARPFLRWRWRDDPLRVFVEQQVYGRTNQGLGETTRVQFDWVLGRRDFLRFVTSLGSNQRDPGWSYEHAVIYRRLFPRQELVLSAELGARHNPYDGDPGTKTPGAADDTDEGYLQFRATGKVYRPWIEYEVTPMVHVPWHHQDALEFGITFELRFVYEHFLRGPAGGPPAAVPSPQPDTDW